MLGGRRDRSRHASRQRDNRSRPFQVTRSSHLPSAWPPPVLISGTGGAGRSQRDYSSQVQAYSGFEQPLQMCVSSLMRKFFGFASAVFACTTT